MAAARILLPVQGSDEVVEIPFSDLPAQAEDVIELLKAEEAPLSLWLESAKAYLETGRVQQFLQVLNEGTGSEVEEHFGDTAKYERIQFFCALGAYNLTLAGTKKERAVQSSHYSTATTLFSKALSISYQELLPHLGLGQLALARRDYTAAQRSFEEATRHKNNGRPSVAGLLALASLHFQLSNFQEALKLYSQVLKKHPDCGADVRLGLAACHMRLNNTSKAKAAFERVLQLDPYCCGALLGLAALALGSKDADPKKVSEGLELLCRAYSSNPSHPGVVSLLAHHCLLQGDYAKAKQLAQHGHNTAETPAVEADSLVQLARAHHALSEWQDAFKSYGQARAMDAKLPLPLLGLAQMHLLQKDGHVTAIGMLESALELVHGWPDALKVLGSLYPQVPGRKTEGSLPHFKGAAQRNAGDAGLWEVVGELAAATDPAAALQAYRTALDLHRKAHATRLAAAEKRAKRAQHRILENGHSEGAAAPASAQGGVSDAVEAQVAVEGLPPKLLNNAAVLHLRLGNVSEGVALMEEAIQSAQSAASGNALPEGSQVTLGYNLARVRESAGQLQAAASEYKSILDQFPGYLACHQRLAAIAQKRGNFGEAESRLQAALKAAPEDPNCLAALGSLYLEQQNFTQAETCFTTLIKLPACKNDPYGWQALGVLNLRKAQAASLQPETRHHAGKALARALECFQTGIQRTPENVYAAHGVGAVLAEQGHTQTAQTIFTLVQEAVVGAGALSYMPELATNAASIQLAASRYQVASQQYSSVSRRFFHGASSRLLLHLARTQYHNNQVLDAKSTLLKALHLSPADHVLRFNVALVLQEDAQRVLMNKDARAQAGELRRYEDYELAYTNAIMASSNFRRLQGSALAVAALNGSSLRGKERLHSHIAFCDRLQKNARTMLDQAREKEVAKVKREAMQRKALQAAQGQQQLEIEREAAQAAAAKAEKEARAQKAQERLAALQGKWAEDAALTQAAETGDAEKVNKARKKKKRKAAEEDAFNSSGDDAPYEGEGERQGRGSQDNEEPEWDDKAADAEDVEPRDTAKVLPSTGLTSSDEDEDPAGTRNHDEQQAIASAPTPSAGRLKKRAHDQIAPSDANDGAGLDDITDDVTDNIAHAVPEEDAVDAELTAHEERAKRARAIFDDSDDE